MKCNKCGTENSSGARFCMSCGSKLEQEKKICNICGAESSGEAMFCQKCGSSLSNSGVKVESVNAEYSNSKKCRICGHENEAKETYCKLCGSQLDDRPSQTYSSSRTLNVKSTSTSAGLVLGIVSAVSGVTCCLFLVALITGAIGVIVSIIALKNEKGNKSKHIIGLVLSIVGLLMGVMMLVSVISAFNNPEFWEEYNKMIEEIQNNGGNLPFKLF